MLGLGQKFPEYKVTAVDALPFDEMNIDNVFIDISDKTYLGKWQVIFFYPKDFTFVCPTEISAFGDLNEDFALRDTQVLTGSTDSEHVHWAWRKHQAELRDLPFPMLADVKRELTTALGILGDDGVAQRATYIVDPNGVIRFVMINDGNVGRNPDEVLRVLDALQTNQLCACNWNKGDELIDPATA